MNEKNYYNNVVELIEELEVNKKVREIKDNRETLFTYWHIGKSIVEAQGGNVRAKYGDNLIKRWGEKLAQEYGKNYDYTNLTRYKKFYLLFSNIDTLCQHLNWSIYRCLLPIKNENERNYYINQVILNNLSVRELRNEIKSKSFERLSYADKENIKIIQEKEENNLTIQDMLKDPIILKVDKNTKKLNEKTIHKYIIELLENKFMELGIGFNLTGHEYKIKINNKTFKIDLLFFNTELDCYIVVEIKSRELQSKDIGQLEFYVSYVDKNIKKNHHNKTIGILIVKKKDKYVIDYITNDNLFITTYKLLQY